MTLPEPDPSEGSNRPSPIALALGVVLLLNVGVIGYFLGQRGDGETTTAEAPSTTEAEDVRATEPETDAALDTTTTTASTTTTGAPETSITEASTTTSTTTASSEPSETTVEGDGASASDADDSAEVEQPTAPSVDVDENGDVVRRAVLSGGVLYLRGAVPTQEISDIIEGKAVAVLGDDRVVNEYEIDPSAPIPEDGEIYVEDLVLFPYGSTEINPAFAPLLDLGAALLLQNPQATLTVVAHTDADGPAVYNLRLSQDRADQVAAYWVSQGVNPDQVVAIGRGEEDPIATNDTPEGAQANRRAEFIVSGLLD